MYADADIYLIDDCLSALDSYVGKNIFHNVLRKYLHEKGKTVIFVTNAIDYTEYCDRVLVMKEGRIVEDGRPEELKGDYASLKNDYKRNIERQ